MAKYPKEEKERLIDDFKKEDIRRYRIIFKVGKRTLECREYNISCVCPVYKFFYFFTVLLNYGIIKVIDSYTYKGFEGRKPRRK